jgi:hypothetical protein
MLVVAYVIELSLETLRGPLDKGFDLRSEGRYIGCGRLLRRIAGRAALSNRGIYAVKLGGFNLPLAELVFRADDRAAFDCLKSRGFIQASRLRGRHESVRHDCPPAGLSDARDGAPQWLLNCLQSGRTIIALPI